MYELALAGGQRYNTEFAACLSDDEARLLDDLLKKMERQAALLTQRGIAKGGPLIGEDAE